MRTTSTSSSRNAVIINDHRITIYRAIREFPNYLYVKGKTSSTTTCYVADVKLFREYLKQNFPSIVYVNQIRRNEIINYQNYLTDLVRNGKYKKTTVDRKFDSLKVFFGYLEYYRHITENFLKDFQFSRIKDTYNKEFDELYMPEYLEPHEIDMIIECARQDKSKNSLRDIAILELLRSTGCRRSSVLELKFEDISFFDNTILIKHQKTQNFSLVKMSPRLKKALLDYSKSLDIPTDYVFRSNRGSQLSINSFDTLIKKYVRLSGLQEKKKFQISSKTFRHSFITQCVRSNIALEKICRYTGHKDVNTLKIYTHLKTDDLDEITSLVG